MNLTEKVASQPKNENFIMESSIADVILGRPVSFVPINPELSEITHGSMWL